MPNFEPIIVAFTCHYCAYAAADLAGVMRLQYPPNIRIIKIPCTGKVDIRHILLAFEKGADGVFVAGCRIGDCHFEDGNIKATRRVKYAKKLLDEVGIGGERLEMFYMSSAEGRRFAEVAAEMTERIKKLGPNPLRNGKQSNDSRFADS